LNWEIIMELFFTIVLTHFIALLTPGVDFFLILKTLMQHNKYSAQAVSLGVALGNAVILCSIYLSLFLVGRVNTVLLDYLKYFGAFYLAYLAFQCFYAARVAHFEPSHIAQPIETSNKINWLKNLSLGLSSSLLNPKNIMFYVTLVVLIYPKYNFIQNTLVCIWMITVVLLWNLGLIQLLSFKIYMVWLKKYLQYLYNFAGICFLIFSIMLFVIH